MVRSFFATIEIKSNLVVDSSNYVTTFVESAVDWYEHE